MRENSKDKYEITGEQLNLNQVTPLLQTLTKIQQEIIKVAQEQMEKHYVLDTENLYMLCIRYIDGDRRYITRDFNELIDKKVLVNGAAINGVNIFDNDIRKQIYQYILEEPGVHFTRIKDFIGKDSRTVKWHLYQLQKFDLIRVENFSNNKIFFDFLLPNEHDNIYYYIQKVGTKEILRAVLEHPNLEFTDLFEMLDYPRSTLTRKFKVLTEEGILTIDREGNKIISISINANYKEIVQKSIYK